MISKTSVLISILIVLSSSITIKTMTTRKLIYLVTRTTIKNEKTLITDSLLITTLVMTLKMITRMILRTTNRSQGRKRIKMTISSTIQLLKTTKNQSNQSLKKLNKRNKSLQLTKLMSKRKLKLLVHYNHLRAKKI